MNKRFLVERHQLVVLLGADLAFTLLVVEHFDSFRVWMKCGQSVEYVQRYIDCLAVAEMLTSVDVVRE